MTNRARIERLLLLNWKGIFFQPFELHEAVTALEGENGAGKTTVMIAAFVALLPDLQRLAFRNVGESTMGVSASPVPATACSSCAPPTADASSPVSVWSAEHRRASSSSASPSKGCRATPIWTRWC